MKKFILLSEIFISSLINAQSKENNNIGVREVSSLDAHFLGDGGPFSGGINEFRKRIIENIDISNITSSSSSSSVKCVVSFIIDKNGLINDIKVEGENGIFNTDVLTAISKIEGKWSPAIYDGKKIDSKFRFPVQIKLEN